MLPEVDLELPKDEFELPKELVTREGSWVTGRLELEALKEFSYQKGEVESLTGRCIKIIFQRNQSY